VTEKTRDFNAVFPTKKKWGKVGEAPALGKTGDGNSREQGQFKHDIVIANWRAGGVRGGVGENEAGRRKHKKKNGHQGDCLRSRGVGPQSFRSD